MRKQRYTFFKGIILVLLSLLFCFKSFLQTNLQDGINMHYPTTATHSDPVDNWPLHATIHPKSSEYNMSDAQMEGSAFRSAISIATEEENEDTLVQVQGAFFLRNKGKDAYLKGETWLTVYPSKGRLGNQMFQIASLIGIADKFGHRPFISSTSFDIDSVFDVPKSKIINVDLTKFNKYNEPDANTFAECDITRYTDMSVLKPVANWTLDGYLQSFKHFQHIQSDVRNVFTFKGNIMKEARRFVNYDGAVQNKVRIGIHIRRGDFLSEYHKNLGRVTPESDYYRKAMDFYSAKYQNVTYFVFSNDITWCKDHLQDFGHEVIFSTYNHPGYDLAIMSLCDHMIISVGTFGWWGGWLAGGTVVYFNGYPKPNSEISKYFIKEDFYPSEWIGIA